MKYLHKPLPDLNDLSLEEQVAQMVVVRASGYLFDHQIQYPDGEPPNAQLQYWLQELAIGGVILSGASAGELLLRAQQLQDWAKIPLLIAADVEEGVGQRFSGATWFPPPMALGAIASKDFCKAKRYAEQMGAITAQEALAIGINWLLAPVVDVNNNRHNPVVNVRAFGETPEAVSHLGSAFIQGTKQYPVLTTAKHFPGYGDVATDSHLELPLLPHSPPRLATVELPPFKAAIAAGVDAIKIAHVLIPAWDLERPATLSYALLTELLRECLRFEGLIVADALVMGAVANHYGSDEASVMAIEAGADILLMPQDPKTLIQSVCDAVAEGRLSRERIRASVERIWKAKGKLIENVPVERQKVGEYRNLTEAFNPEPHTQTSRPLFGTSPVTSQHLVCQLAQPTARTTATTILQESQKIGGSLPLQLDSFGSSRKRRNLIVVDDIIACDFLEPNAPAIALPRQLGYELQLVDPHILPIQEEASYRPAFPPTLLQLFIRGNPFREGAKLTAVADALLKKLLKIESLQALVIYGSPYALEQFLPELPSKIPYVFSYGQLPEAQAIALDVLFSNSVPTPTFTLLF